MLTALRIENFAIVSELELDFSTGMTAFTGETGAGKSIMIDALMLALGGRADASVIRLGAEKCEITACFDITSNCPSAHWLSEHDLSNDEHVIYLRRIISTEGRSKSYINGHPFPLQKVKELSEMLVDIHGQHQHQTLLQHATHRQQLDQFAKHHDLVTTVSHLYQHYQQIKHELQQGPSLEAAQEQAHLLEQHIEELAQLEVREGEMQALHEEHQLLHHACEYLEHAQHIMALLSDDEHLNICRSIHLVLQKLNLLPQESKPIKTAVELMNTALIQCEEAMDEISSFSTQVQLNPERLEEVETRMSLLHQAARKYHIDASQLPQHLIQLQEEYQALQHREQAQYAQQKALEETYAAYEQAALTLRASRQQHAITLAEKISASIRQLGMPKGYITVEMTPLDKMQAHGLDKVEYRVCTNPGMLPDTLAKVASGGELSRIGLAIHVITAERGATPTLLFDEVDVGIGGATASLVGQLLRKLSERLQVFCVTHQPQVASSAHHHFKVEKHSDQEHTFSHVVRLDASEKMYEIARMLGGLTITEQSCSHAKELLAQHA